MLLKEGQIQKFTEFLNGLKYIDHGCGKYKSGRSVTIHYHVDKKAGIFTIETINVSPKQRNKGIGMALIETACRVAPVKAVVVSEIINDNLFNALIRRGFVQAGDNERDLTKFKEN